MNTDYPKTLDEAKNLFKANSEADPFPSIPSTLLSSEHIQAYAAAVGLVFPFKTQTKIKDKDQDNLKSASYRVYATGEYIYWDRDGIKRKAMIGFDDEFTIMPNSITYIHLDTYFLLPDYIAVRFNLAINHVHRGLLLGTGPLVDPGFSSRILVPIHNLTSSNYKLKGSDSLIWVEFTKTSKRNIPSPEKEDNERNIKEYKFYGMPVFKKDRSPEQFFEEANNGNPITNSLDEEIKRIDRKIVEAQKDFKNIRDYTKTFTLVGVITMVGLAFTMGGFIETMRQNHMSLMDRLKDDALKKQTLERDAEQYRSDINAIKAAAEGLRIENNELRSRLMETQSYIIRNDGRIQDISDRLSQAAKSKQK